MTFDNFFGIRRQHITNAACRLVFLFLITLKAQAQFTAGNLVVLQAGNGATPLANTGNMIVLREFSPPGSSGLLCGHFFYRLAP